MSLFYKIVLIIFPFFILKANSQFQYTRVVGGSPTTIERYPIIAQLLLDMYGNQQQYIQHCAGVILTSRHVISAAHCFQYRGNGRDYTQPKFWKIRVGSAYRSRGGFLHNLKTIITRSDFDKYYYKNDVAVAIVSQPFTFGATVRQATIPKLKSEIKPNSVCTLIGWGTTEADGSQPEQLQHAALLSIDQNVCVQRYNTIGAVITDSMMCAGHVDVGGLDGCFGDSGGPLIYKGVVVGLVSFGYACGHRYYPGVYTKISYFTDWIVNTISTNK